MVKKRKGNNNKSKAKSPSLKEIFFSERTNFLVGFFLMLIACFMVLSFISYLNTGQMDQSLLVDLRPGAFQNAERSIQNTCGSLGAITSYFFITCCFGLPAFLIPVFIFITGLKQMEVYPKINLWKWFLAFAVVMLWCSVFFAKFLTVLFSESVYNPGGSHGLFV